jgi:hypothetical protein
MVVQCLCKKRAKTTLHACKTRSPKIEPLRVQTNRICHFAAIASVHCTTLHNFFCSLAFLLNRREQFRVKLFTLFVSCLRAPCLQAPLTCAHDVYIYRPTYFIRCGAAAGIFNAWNRAQNTVYNLAQRSPHRQQQQHDREQQQQKDQEWRRFHLLSDCNDYDREDIIISIDDDVSAMSSSPTTSSSTLVEGTRSNNNNDHNQKNPKTPMMKQQQEDEKKKDRKVKVVSFRLSERDYERHLSMAKLCHENGLTKGPDIVSYIRLSMECLWQYINNNSQARVEPSAEKKEENRQQPQKRQEGGVEQQDVSSHIMTAPSSSRAAAATTNTAAMRGEQHTGESITRTPPPPPPLTPPLFNNLHEYFQPVFDEVDNLNKMLDSHIEEENDGGKEKKKKK